MIEPLVSVIMPIYNSEKFLEPAIKSVIAQTYSNWELWLIDDCSNDNSVAIIKQFVNIEPRIKEVYLKQNSGSAISRNIAIERSNGKYIAFLDADDIWEKEKLFIQIRFMEENNYVFTYSFYDIINKTADQTKKIITAPLQLNYSNLLKNNTIGCLTAVYNTEVLGKLQMPNIRKRQDYGLWLDILQTGITAYCIPTVLAHYRIETGSLSQNKIKVLSYNWLILRKYQQLSFFSSVYYFSCFLLNKSIKYARK